MLQHPPNPYHSIQCVHSVECIIQYIVAYLPDHDTTYAAIQTYCSYLLNAPCSQNITTVANISASELCSVDVLMIMALDCSVIVGLDMWGRDNIIVIEF